MTEHLRVEMDTDASPTSVRVLWVDGERFTELVDVVDVEISTNMESGAQARITFAGVELVTRA